MRRDLPPGASQHSLSAAGRRLQWWDCLELCRLGWERLQLPERWQCAPCPEADEQVAVGSKGAHRYGGQKKGVMRPLGDVKFSSWASWFWLLSSLGAECPVYVFIACNNRCFLMSAWTDSLLSGFVPQNYMVGRAIGTCFCLLCF